jgi:two-component system chemotaxis sensor kinase CheA
MRAMKNLNKKKIMIVDDDERNVFALSLFLKSEGAQCLSAKNGKECIDLLEENFDLDYIVMDIMMPIMDGYAAIRHIKSRQNTHHIPVVALTANAMKGDKAKCLKSGADGYLSKPVDLNALLDVFKQFNTKFQKNNSIKKQDIKTNSTKELQT